MTEDSDARADDGDGDGDRRSLDADGFREAVEAVGEPVVTAERLARELGWSQSEAAAALDALVESGRVGRTDVSGDPVVFYPAELAVFADPERVILFPDRREVVVEQPAQFTRARLNQFAHLVDTNRDGAYIYEIREEDVWLAPYDSIEELLRTMHDTLGQRSPALEEFVERQWARARKFALVSREDYTVLEAASADLMGNVARQKLDDDLLHGLISDTEAWVHEGEEGEVKRTLYDAGYPVQDLRDLETGDPLDVDLRLRLRDYQREWVEEFEERGAGVFVGPPGSGKTVAAIGAMARVGGETLILVPSRELATQWREELLTNTTLSAEQVGEYHGGEKEIRPVTIATYQTAGMDRHRTLFEDRRWGLIVYDEVHHVSSPIWRRSTDLQTKSRLGLSATPVREDDNEREIFTLIGPPIGTDWSKLFEAGYVAEPEVEIRFVEWPDETVRNEYATAQGHERREVAATNPAKVDAVGELLADHDGAKALVFVEYLDHGRQLAGALEAPFVSGETPHAERERLFREFRGDERDVLVVSRVGDEGIDLPNAEVAIVASGLGGSRRQGAQRAGRTMRPEGTARMYVLATRGTTEEDFARRQIRHLASKGVRVVERDVRESEAVGGAGEGDVEDVERAETGGADDGDGEDTGGEDASAGE